ncbi:MAG: sulfatase-like hydrolase/transferase, partial [bacterium]|nr:sulfatase-like hydrolase/transferase [bacterium]
MLQRILLTLAVALFLFPQTSLLGQDAEQPPNIVVILADDFGVGDIQAHYPENKIATPYLDKLVREGMSFTDAHSPSAVCSPTRYGLLTGRYCWRTRMQEWVIAAYEPPLINAERLTLPKFLRDHGYETACLGKWHLGWDWVGPQEPRMHVVERNFQKKLNWDFTRAISGGPTARGFDYYFGVDLPNMPPFCWIENDRVTEQPTAAYQYVEQDGFVVMPRGFEGSPMAPGWKFDHILPELTRRGVEYIRQHAADDKPFFLYFSQTSPHEPVVPSSAFKGRSGIAPIA